METGGREKVPVRVTIGTHSFSLVTSEDPAEVVSLANGVDELIQGIAARSGNVDFQRASILACLHLADQLRGVQRELHALREQVEQKAKRISGLLDQVID